MHWISHGLEIPKDEYCPDWTFLFYEQYLLWSGRYSEKKIKYPELGRKIRDIGEHTRARWLGWPFYITEHGNMAMVPAYATRGDAICVLFGAPVPTVLRPLKAERPNPARRHLFFRLHEKGESKPEAIYKRVGTAFMRGTMQGKIMELLERKKIKPRNFPLV